MKTARGLPLLLFSFLLACPAAGADGDGRVAGYYKAFFTVSGSRQLGSVSNRLRLKYSAATFLGGLNAAYSVSPRLQDQSLYSSQSAPFASDSAAPDYRAADLRSPFAGPEGTFAVYQNLDRLYFKASFASADLYAGRQAVSWGSGKAVNPTDVLAPFRFDELDAEERRGIDAVRLRVPSGAFGEWDFGYAAGKDLRSAESAVFARRKLDMKSADVTATLLDFRQNLLAGIDAAGSLGGAGVWLESAYVFSKFFESGGGDGDYLRLSAGADYNFTEKAYGYLEYHFNGAGAEKPGDYLSNALRSPYSDGAVYLLGRHYLVPGASYQLTPLIACSAQAFANLLDGSCAFNPYLDCSVAQNVYVSAGAFIGTGNDGGARLLSEFGSYPGTYYSSLRVYF